VRGGAPLQPFIGRSVVLIYNTVEVPNSQRMSCLDSSLGTVWGRVRFLAEAILMVVLQGALLQDRDDPGQVSL
jgi:hypothetical protein